MTSFFDLRDLRNGQRRRLVLCGWLIAVVAATLILFLFSYTDMEYPAYAACILLSLVMLAAECAFIFRSSGCRVTPLLIFLAAFYLARNSQLLLILFGVRFDAHHLVRLRQYLKLAVALTSAGNIWAGFAGVLIAAPQKALPEKRKVTDAASPVLARTLTAGLILTGVAAFAGLWWSEMPKPLVPVGELFVPFGFATAVLYAKLRRGALAAGLLAGYFLLSAFFGNLGGGIAGLLVLTVFFCCLWEVPGKRSHNAAVLLSVTLLLAVLSILLDYLNAPGLYAGRNIGEIAIHWISRSGRGCLALAAMVSVVPTSEAFLFGREYAAAVLKGIVPTELDPSGTLTKLTSDTRVWKVWDEKYLETISESIGFSADAEGYLNFGVFGFLAVFLVCLGMAFLLDRYRSYDGRHGAFARYAACVMLWAGLTVPGNDLSHLIRMFVWGVVLMGLLWSLCGRGKSPESEKN